MAFSGVFVGYLHPNDLAASFVSSLQSLQAFDALTPPENGGALLRRWAAVRAGAMGIPEARNQIAAEFLNESDCEWLLFIDADMGFLPDTVARLVAAADPDTAPIVGGLAFAYREFGSDGFGGYRSYPLPTLFEYELCPDNEYRFVGRRHYRVNTLEPVRATGAAILLIHRSVVAAVHEHYGPHWFDRIGGADGLMGEDVSFFVRTGALDFPAHVHTGIRTTHAKTIWLAESDFWASFVAPPATETVDVVVPTIAQRTTTLERLATTLRASTGLAELWFVVDDEDHAAIAKPYGNTIIRPGSYAVKANEAFRQLESNGTPWLKLVGDDVRFHPGWLDHAQHVAGLYAADVVGSNDLANPRVTAGDHATHFMVRKTYVTERGGSWDGPGVLAHEGYRHWFVDDEIVTVAKRRGVFQSALGSIVEHMHPIAGKADNDAVYDLGAKWADNDERTFRQRLADHA